MNGKCVCLPLVSTIRHCMFQNHAYQLTGEHKKEEKQFHSFSDILHFFYIMETRKKRRTKINSKAQIQLWETRFSCLTNRFMQVIFRCSDSLKPFLKPLINQTAVPFAASKNEEKVKVLWSEFRLWLYHCEFLTKAWPRLSRHWCGWWKPLQLWSHQSSCDRLSQLLSQQRTAVLCLW